MRLAAAVAQPSRRAGHPVSTHFPLPFGEGGGGRGGRGRSTCRVASRLRSLYRGPLRRRSESAIADGVDGLEVVARCRCETVACASFWTRDPGGREGS